MHLLNQVWLQRGLLHAPINALLTFTWVTMYEHGTQWISANSPSSLLPLLWMVFAQTGISLLAARWTEPRWPRLGRFVAIAVGQLAVPLILLGSYATAAWGLTLD